MPYLFKARQNCYTCIDFWVMKAMEEKKFENQNLNSELFQEYLDSLPDENEQKKTGETETEIPSGISEQVEKDLMDYKRRGYAAHDVRDDTAYRSRTRRRRGAAVVPLIIAGSAAAIAISAFSVFVMANRTYDEQEHYYPPVEEEYVDPYEEEYNKMSGQLSQPEIFLNGHYVKLPLKMSEFMQEGWKIRTSAFNETADTVGSEPVSFHIESEWGEEIAEVSVVSPTGEEVPVSEGLITGLFTDNESYWYELNGGIYVGSSTWTVENALKEEGLDWVKRGNDEGSRYIIESAAENEYGYDEYVLRLELEDDYVERITMQLSQSAQE